MPLSPVLFIICTKGFKALLEDAACRGSLQGIKVATGAPIISHLLFTDDNLLFARVDLVSASSLQNVIKLYEAASGQQVNFQKSSVCFSSNVPRVVAKNIKPLLNVGVVAIHTKYLGLPSTILRSRREIFDPPCTKISGMVEVEGPVYFECWEGSAHKIGGSGDP